MTLLHRNMLHRPWPHPAGFNSILLVINQARLKWGFRRANHLIMHIKSVVSKYGETELRRGNLRGMSNTRRSFFGVTSASYWGFSQSFCMKSVKTFAFRHRQMFCVEKEDVTFCQRAIWLSFGRGGCCTIGCLSILRARFCSFSSEPFSKQWSGEFHDHFLNKLSCVPLSDLFHVCTVQPQTLASRTQSLLTILPCGWCNLPQHLLSYFNTNGYLSDGISKKQHPMDLWSFCLPFLPSLQDCVWTWRLTHCRLGLDPHSIDKGGQQVAMFI